MSSPTFVAKMPRLALFALVGMFVALLWALTAGELVWYLLRPSPLPAAPQAAEPVVIPAPPTPAGPQLAITAAPVTVYPGGKNTFGVRVARDRFDEPIAVRFEAPNAITAAEIIIPAGDSVGKAEVVAPPDAKPGTFTLTATATAAAGEHALAATTPVRVTVTALPPAPRRIAVATSPRVHAYPKGKNTFGVNVTRDGFDGPITVTFGNLPAGVKIPAVTLPAGKTDATAELTAEAGAKIGETKITVTARSAPGIATAAVGEIVAEVLDPTRISLDIVLVLDCTGSMKKYVDVWCEHFPAFAAELKPRFDVRFGVVGFRDTTLGQPLELARIDGELMSANAGSFVRTVRGLRLGGGGGDGESSLDGVAEAADYPLRASAARVLLLVTDGGPKRVDGRMRSAEMAARHLRAKRIDQLHVITFQQFRRGFEPLWEGPKGRYFDLKAATERNEFDKLMTDLNKAIVGNIPALPEAKPEPSATAPLAVLPAPEPVKPPNPPAAPEPDEPKFAPVARPDAQPPPEPKEHRAEPPPRGALALIVWAVMVAVPARLMLLLGQLTFLPGERLRGAVGAVGYGAGLVVGLGAGVLAYLGLDSLGVPLLARLGAASLFGLFNGLMVPLAESFFCTKVLELEDAENITPPPLPVLDLPPVEAYSTASANPAPELDLPPVETHPSVPVHKPNITAAPKPGDGCPGCGRKIPGAIGTRYCMLCDNTF